MELSVDIEFVCEHDGVHVYSVRCGDITRLVTVREEDLEEEGP